MLPADNHKPSTVTATVEEGEDSRSVKQSLDFVPNVGNDERKREMWREIREEEDKFAISLYVVIGNQMVKKWPKESEHWPTH